MMTTIISIQALHPKNLPLRGFLLPPKLVDEPIDFRIGRLTDPFG